MPAPKNLWRPKSRPTFFAIMRTFKFDSEYLRNESTYQKSGKLFIINNHSHVRRKNFAYFGPQTKKLLTLIYVHPNGLFSGDYISALRGCCALKFLHTLEIGQGLLARTRRGTGVLPPPQKKNRENLKLALKFSVLESITYGIVEVFSLNFLMRPAITARGISSSWNWFCTRTCGAGRPHVWLCHARLVLYLVLTSYQRGSEIFLQVQLVRKPSTLTTSCLNAHSIAIGPTVRQCPPVCRHTMLNEWPNYGFMFSVMDYMPRLLVTEHSVGSYHLNSIKLSCDFLSAISVSVTHRIYHFRDIERGNDNIHYSVGWSDLQTSFKVIERGTNQKLVYELLTCY